MAVSLNTPIAVLTQSTYGVGTQYGTPQTNPGNAQAVRLDGIMDSADASNTNLTATIGMDISNDGSTWETVATETWQGGIDGFGNPAYPVLVHPLGSPIPQQSRLWIALNQALSVGLNQTFS